MEAQFLVTANVSRPLILVTMMVEATNSSETSDITRATRRHIQENDILHNHRREIIKSNIACGKASFCFSVE
jgi:hypothetical protein